LTSLSNTHAPGPQCSFLWNFLAASISDLQRGFPFFTGCFNSFPIPFVLCASLGFYSLRRGSLSTLRYCVFRMLPPIFALILDRAQLPCVTRRILVPSFSYGSVSYFFFCPNFNFQYSLGKVFGPPCPPQTLRLVFHFTFGIAVSFIPYPFLSSPPLHPGHNQKEGVFGIFPESVPFESRSCLFSPTPSSDTGF